MKFFLLGYLTFALIKIVLSQGCGDPQWYFDCGNDECVQRRYLCDWKKDCSNGNDEYPLVNPQLCPECSQYQWKCNNSYCLPIPGYPYICDGKNDCLDNSDEFENPEDCPECMFDDLFRCKSGQCILGFYQCDDKIDCIDGSDEPEDPDLCPACENDDFRCTNGRCIPRDSVCDGYADCKDGIDEPEDSNDCPACGQDKFRCNNGRCIERRLVCDGHADCADESDEPEDRDDCPACLETEFRCTIGKCIEKEMTCNENNDCGDWSDEGEEQCPCEEDEVRCPGYEGEPGTFPPGICIPEEYWCDPDGIMDCWDGSDEANCTQRN